MLEALVERDAVPLEPAEPILADELAVGQQGGDPGRDMAWLCFTELRKKPMSYAILTGITFSVGSLNRLPGYS